MEESPPWSLSAQLIVRQFPCRTLPPAPYNIVILSEARRSRRISLRRDSVGLGTDPSLRSGWLIRCAGWQSSANLASPQCYSSSSWVSCCLIVLHCICNWSTFFIGNPS